MKAEYSHDHSPEPPVHKWGDGEFYTVIMDVIQDKTSNDKPPSQIINEEDASPLFARVLKAAKRFGEGAATLSKAFLWSAATGKLIIPGEPSPECGKLREAMKELLSQLHWLDKGQIQEELDDTISAPQGELAAKTLAIAVRLKILQRAAQYCHLCGETLDTSQRLVLIRSMHRHYLKQMANLQKLGKN